MKTYKMNDELKNRFRKMCININSVKKENNGFLINWYSFSEKNFKTRCNKSFFSSESEIEGWVISLEESK
jgi:hypothetical protein